MKQKQKYHRQKREKQTDKNKKKSKKDQTNKNKPKKKRNVTSTEPLILHGAPTQLTIARVAVVSRSLVLRLPRPT